MDTITVHGLALKINFKSIKKLDFLLVELAHKGVTLIDKEPKIGAKGTRMAFIHPKSTGGVLIELCEPI